MSFREIERSEKRTPRRNVKFRELIRSIESVSEVTRRAFKGSAAAVFIELAKVNLLAAPKTGPRTIARPDQNRINNRINDLEKS